MAIVINGTGTIAGVSATGITTAPTNATDTSKLPLAGGTMSGALTITAGTAKFKLEEIGGSYGELEAGGAGLHIKAKTGGYITLKPNDTEAIRILSNGKVGIGTTASTEKLQVNGAIRSTNNATTSLADSGNFYYIPTADDSSNPRTVISGVGTSSVGGHVTFKTGTSSSNTEKARITSAGNVGIGTTSPASARGIGGSVLHISHGTDAALRITDTGGSDFEISAESITSMGTVDATDLAVISNNTERMRITSAGNLGINVTAPQRALHVKPPTNEDTGIIAETHSAGDALSIYSKGSSSHNWVTGLDNDGSGGNGFSFAYKSNGYPSLSSNSRVTIHTTGQMYVPSGVRLGGDDAAHTLDDYEKGTFTPVFKDNSNNTVSGSLGSCTFTKVGDLCSVQVYWSSGTNGTLKSMTLPFQSLTTGGNCRSVGQVVSYNAPIPQRSNETIIVDGVARADFWQLRGNAASYFYLDIDNNSEYFFTWTYQTET